MITIPQTIINKVTADAIRNAPAISCSVLAGDGSAVSRYFACTNVAEDPDRQFETASSEMLGIQEECEADSLEILGICYSAPEGSARPSPEITQNWLASYLCFVVAIRNPAAPELKAFRLHGGRFIESPVRIVSDDDAARDIDSETNDEVHDHYAGRRKEESAGMRERDASAEGDLIQELRRNFSENRYLGWYFLLKAMQARGSLADWDTCRLLTAEMDLGYDLSFDERRLATDLRDWVLFQRGGVDALWAHYSRSLQDGSDSPESHFRLAMVFERQSEFVAARQHLNICVGRNFGEVGGNLVESALHALEDEQRTGTKHGLFEALWRPVIKGPEEPSRELAGLLREVLEGPNWRLGRVAVEALESLGDVENLGRAMSSASFPVRIAAIAALRRIDITRTGSILHEAMDSQSDLERWQAVCHLAQNGPGETALLRRAVQGDPDVSVRLVAAKGLGRTGDREAIAALRSVPQWTDALGESLQQVANDAILQIESPWLALPLSSDAADLRGQALNRFVSGDYNGAEQILRDLLVNGFERPSTHCHLARVLLMQDRQSEASEELESAWSCRDEGEPYVAGRILFLRYLLSLLHGAWDDEALAGIKTILYGPGLTQQDWTIRPVLEHVVLPPEEMEFLLALADTLSGQAELAELDTFARWSNITIENDFRSTTAIGAFHHIDPWFGDAASGQQRDEEDAEGMPAMTFAHHITELLRRVSFSLISFVTASVISAIVLHGHWLSRSSMALGYGMVYASPICYIQIMRFVLPGLYKRERRLAHIIGPLVVLSLAGISFLIAYFICTPVEHMWIRAFDVGDPTFRITTFGLMVKASVIIAYVVCEALFVFVAWSISRFAPVQRRTRYFLQASLRATALFLVPAALVAMGVWLLSICLLIGTPLGILYLRSEKGEAWLNNLKRFVESRFDSDALGIRRAYARSRSATPRTPRRRS